MNPKSIVDALGGVPKTAALAGCSIQAVYSWIRAGVIPARSLRMLRLARPKTFRDLEAAQEAPKQ